MVFITTDIAIDCYCVKSLYGLYRDKRKNHSIEDKALFYPQRGFVLLEVHLIMKITNIKQFPITEIRKSKQCLALEGFGH